MTTRILTWLALIGLAVFFVSRIYWIGHTAGADKVRVEWNTEREATFKAYNESMAVARENEHQAQLRALKQREVFDAQVSSLNSHVQRLSDRLRDKPGRPGSTGLPEATSPAVHAAEGCSGAQLYREDGQFLVWEAARAERFRLALIQCIDAYTDMVEDHNTKP